MSRIIDILTAIRNGETYTGEPLSRVEAILKSIANKTPYTATAQSRHEQLLLAIKNGQTVSGTARTRVEEILFAIANGTLDAYLSGKNLFDAEKAFNTGEVQEYYKKYTVYTGIPNENFFVDTNTPQQDRQDGFALKCAAYDYSRTFYWLYSTDTEIGRGVVASDNNGRVSFYWGYDGDNWVDDEVVKEHLSKMQLTIGSTATPYSTYAFLSELESAYVSVANKLKGA